ncbi:GspH/FimT family pseudopilin [Erwinia sp.]|uniref:GspH/FimT family pseudopilin n=1 Tax=Erwinia citreus TaxID=558 RepID=UPI003C727189
MKTMSGFTLTELLIVMVIASILTLGAISGWQNWQQRQRLNDSARQLQHFLLRLRSEANEHNSPLLLWQGKGPGWCVGSGQLQPCGKASRHLLPAPWPEIRLLSLTEGMGFYGRGNVARPGRIVISGDAGERHIVVSSRGRVRICEDNCL